MATSRHTSVKALCLGALAGVFVFIAHHAPADWSTTRHDTLVPAGEGGYVQEFRESPDGEWVAYRATEDLSGRRIDLYISSTAPGGGHRLVRPQVPGGGEPLPDFEFSPDGRYLFFLWEADDSSNAGLYRYRIATDTVSNAIPGAPGIEQVLNFKIAPDSSSFAYQAYQSAPANTVELYGAPIVGETVRLNGPLPSNGNVGLYEFAPDAEWVYFMAPEDSPGLNRVYRVRPDGTERQEVSSGLAADQSVYRFQLSPLGGYLFYQHGETLQSVDLGTLEQVELAPEVPVRDFWITPVGEHVIVSDLQVSSGPPPGYRPAYTSNFHSTSFEGGETVSVASAELSGSIVLPRMSPDGSAIAFAPTPHNGYSSIDYPAIYSAPLSGEGRVELALPDDVLEITAFVFRPNSTDLLVQYENNGHLLDRVPVDGSEAVNLAATGSQPFHYNAEADRALYWGRNGLTVVSGSGGPETTVAETPENGEFLDYRLSHDGETVFFIANYRDPASFELFQVPATGGTPERLNGTLRVPRTVEDFLLAGNHLLWKSQYLVDDRSGGYLYRDSEIYSDRLDRAPHPFRRTGDKEQVLLYTASADTNWGVALEFDHDPEAGMDQRYQHQITAFRLDHPSWRQVLGELPYGHSPGGITKLEFAPNGTTVGLLIDDTLYTADVLQVESLREIASARDCPGLSWYSNGLTEFSFTPDSETIVFRADDPSTAGKFELGAAPADDSSSPVLISGELSENSEVFPGFAISPDGTTAVYLSDYNQDGSDSIRLYAAPIPGTGARQGGPIVLSADPAGIGGVHDFKINPAGGQVVYRAGSFEIPRRLWSVPITGGESVLLTDEGQPDMFVNEFEFTNDGSRIVYRADQDAAGLPELFSIPSSGGSSVQVTNDFGNTRDVLYGWRIIPGDRVVFRQFPLDSEPSALYSAPATGGEIARLSPAVENDGVFGFKASANGEVVDFIMSPLNEDGFDLYTNSATGGTAHQVNAGTDLQDNVWTFDLNPTGDIHAFKAGDSQASTGIYSAYDTDATPTPTPSPTGTPTPSPTGTATPTPTVTPTPTPPWGWAIFDFPDDEQGWEFHDDISMDPADIDGAYNTADGGLDTMVASNFGVFGYWESPLIALNQPVEEHWIAGETGDASLYRYDVEVQSNVSQRDTPIIRLRFSSEDFQRTDLTVVTSAGDGWHAPPTAPRVYTSLFQLPEGSENMRIDFDVLNVDPMDAANATLSVGFVSVKHEGTGWVSDGTEILSHDFTENSADELGWVSDFDQSGALNPPGEFTDTGEGLLIRGQADGQRQESLHFGFWTCPTGQAYPGERVYRARWTVGSDATAETKSTLPGFRLRVNESSLNLATVTHLESVNGSVDLPTASEDKVYDQWFITPEGIDGNEIFLSFDYLFVGGGDTPDDPGLELILRSVELTEYPIPAP